MGTTASCWILRYAQNDIQGKAGSAIPPYNIK